MKKRLFHKRKNPNKLQRFKKPMMKLRKRKEIQVLLLLLKKYGKKEVS